jgi:hypothetical protein
MPDFAGYRAGILHEGGRRRYRGWSKLRVARSADAFLPSTGSKQGK